MTWGKVFDQTQASVAVGSPEHFDVRGMRGLVVILDGGTATTQPCDEDGTVVPGSAATAVTSEALVDANWSHYLVTATGAACTVCVV